MKFLKRKNPKGRGRRTPARKPKTPRAWDQARAWRVFRIGTTCALLLAVGLGLTLGRHWISQQVAADPDEAEAEIVFERMPRWMRDGPAETLTRRVSEHWTGNPLDADALHKIAEALEDSAWIEQVNRVQRISATRLEIAADYRAPAAVVAGNGGFYLIDERGVRLPRVYAMEKLRPLGLLPMVGVASDPPKPGAVWPGGDVQAGLDLTRLIESQPWTEQVRAIDVTNFQHRADRRRPHLLLLTDRGTVRWGRAPGDEGVLEPSASRKLAMLQRVAETYDGRIDARGRVVDVFTDTPLVHAAPDDRTTANR